MAEREDIRWLMESPALRRTFLAIVVLILAAGVTALVSDGTGSNAVALTLGGIAVVVMVAAAFYAVGLSEDRERARTK